MKGVLRSIILILVVFFLFPILINPDECYGLIPIEFLANLTLHVLWFVLIISIGITAIRNRKEFRKLYFSVGVAFLSAMLIASAHIYLHLKYNRNKIFVAESHEGPDDFRIALMDNGIYKIHYGHVDIGCYLYGSYTFNGDTLILDMDSETGKEIPDTYFLSDTTLIPLTKTDLVNSSLKISQPKTE